MSIEKQIEHWKTGADDALETADLLFKNNKNTYALFFCHLAVEKWIKTLVMRKTGVLAPKIHNLIRLSELAGLEMPEEKLEDLGALNKFNLAGRYVETIGQSNPEATKFWLDKTKEIMLWLRTK